MPPSQRHLVGKTTAGISTPPPINTAEQPALSARERLRLHVQRNLQAQEQKAKQLAEQHAAAACSGIPVLPLSLPGQANGRNRRNDHQSAGLQSLYAPIQDTRLGLNDIADTDQEAAEIAPAPCILSGASDVVVAADGFPPLNTSELGTDIGLETNSESPPDFDDTPPNEQDVGWYVTGASMVSSAHNGAVGHGGEDEWVEALIDI